MTVFRIAKTQFAADLSGKGAEMFGGRWNSVGVPLFYTSCYRSLCVLEHLVHLPSASHLEGYSIITLSFPDTSLFQEIKLAELPDDCKSNPLLLATQLMGDQFFIECQYLALKVPSVIIPTEFNLLFNPRHPDFNLVKLDSVEPFIYDNRLVKR